MFSSRPSYSQRQIFLHEAQINGAAEVAVENIKTHYRVVKDKVKVKRLCKTFKSQGSADLKYLKTPFVSRDIPRKQYLTPH